MPGKAHRRLLVIVAVLAVAGGLVAQATGFVRSYERDLVDARFGVRGLKSPPRVVVVGIDDKTFDELEVQWPFRRSLHAELIDALAKAGARTIAYDVQFTEPTPAAADAQAVHAAREDDALITAVKRAGNVVLATTEVNERGESAVFGGEEVLRAIGGLQRRR